MEDYKKKYKDALAKAREIHRNEDEKRFDMEWLFPELAESEDERIRKDIISFLHSKNGYMNPDEDWNFHNRWLPWLEKQVNCSAKWQKNTPHNKPAIKHSVLMKTTQGIAEGEWQGEDWFQYRWSWTLKESNVLAWMELSDLDEQGEQKPTSDIKYEVKDGDSLSVNGKPFDYEKATITQKDYAPRDYNEIDPNLGIPDWVLMSRKNPVDKVEPKFKVGDWITIKE